MSPEPARKSRQPSPNFSEPFLPESKSWLVKDSLPFQFCLWACCPLLHNSRTRLLITIRKQLPVGFLFFRIVAPPLFPGNSTILAGIFESSASRISLPRALNG